MSAPYSRAEWTITNQIGFAPRLVIEASLQLECDKIENP